MIYVFVYVEERLVVHDLRENKRVPTLLDGENGSRYDLST